MKLPKILSVFVICTLMSGSAFCAPGKAYNVTLFPKKHGQAVLYPVSVQIFAENPQSLARHVLDELCRIQEKNSARFPSSLAVSVTGNCATVRLFHPERLSLSEEDELLTVYSVVNSLTSTGDIVTVEFLINGKRRKNYAGFIDMRESFIPDYAVCE